MTLIEFISLLLPKVGKQRGTNLMSRQKLDYVKIRELSDTGATVTKIAETMGTTPGAVSKVLKKMGIQVAAVMMAAAPEYKEKKNAATEHLFYLCDKARKELEWIEDTRWRPPRPRTIGPGRTRS